MEFIEGTIEAIPLPADSVDVVISNCVINLAADKSAVLAEIARVLRPGGRMGVSDIVAGDDLSPADRAERGSYAGCIAGALSFDEYERGLGGRRPRRRVRPADARGRRRDVRGDRPGDEACERREVIARAIRLRLRSGLSVRSLIARLNSGSGWS